MVTDVGRRVAPDLALVGIGVGPATGPLAADLGLDADGGVPVDAGMRTTPRTDG